MKHYRIAIASAIVILGSNMAVAHTQQTADASKQAAKVAPTALIKLIGKSRAEVEVVVGKTTNIGTPVSNTGKAEGICLEWGGDPPDLSVTWAPSGKMTSIMMPSADTWRKTLHMYGLKSTGVKTKQTPDKPGRPAYKLIGVTGIPTGWYCTWYDYALAFDRTPGH